MRFEAIGTDNQTHKKNKRKYIKSTKETKPKTNKLAQVKKHANKCRNLSLNQHL